MTELLEKAIEYLRKLDADRQDAIATLIMEELENEAKWDAAFASSHNLLADLAAEAMAEYNAGQTQVLNSMDKLNHYRQLIQEILTEYGRIPYKHGDIKFETVFDSESDRYLLIILGREKKKYHHGCLIHVDIIDDKIWIQLDGTEVGIANELVDAGVPKDQIVLGFKSPELRKDTEFAVM